MAMDLLRGVLAAAVVLESIVWYFLQIRFAVPENSAKNILK